MKFDIGYSVTITKCLWDPALVGRTGKVIELMTRDHYLVRLDRSARHGWTHTFAEYQLERDVLGQLSQVIQ